MPGDPEAARHPIYLVRIVRLIHRIRPDAPVEDVWRLLGTTNAPHEKQDLWSANDLRLGDGARLATERTNELLAQTPDRVAHVSELRVRENLDFRLTIGPEREELNLLWTDASGRLRGRRFTDAQAGLRLVCRGDPDRPDAVRVAIMPEVVYGQQAMRWVRTEVGLVQRMGRSRLALADLAVEVRLLPGRLLVLGGRRSANLSLGAAFFYERRGPDFWGQTIILTAERLLPRRVPEGETVPFLQPVGGS